VTGNSQHSQHSTHSTATALERRRSTVHQYLPASVTALGGQNSNSLLSVVGEYYEYLEATGNAVTDRGMGELGLPGYAQVSKRLDCYNAIEF
jgi:hypothetical protein